MTTGFLGTTFPPDYQWHHDEVSLISRLTQQIDRAWPQAQNLLVNTTWFGPQFSNGVYQQFLDRVAQQRIDNLFFLAAADPVFLNPEQLEFLVQASGCGTVRYLGHFDSEYQFNFHSTVLPKYFKTYDQADLVMQNPEWVFVNYNRKPRGHRIDLVNKILEHDLQHQGVISLGKSDDVYNNGSRQTTCLLLGEEPDDYAQEGNWGMGMEFGIPHDIHSLGNMRTWQGHFLTVVSETEFWSWDNTFVSEKTWKPIMGLRPFVINGQTKIYQYLRQHGFRTFNHHWPHIDIETGDVHDTIIEVIRWLSSKPREELSRLYQAMLPDLMHNRDHFYEFSRSQISRTERLFD